MENLNKAHKEGVVVGLKEVAGVYPRMDIDRLLLNHPDLFNLLLIALLELKGDNVPWEIDDDFKVRKSDKMSYYQIAGIHGLPRQEWDHVSAPGKKPDSKVPGYCAHGTPTFGPWHRPYLAMIEQTLFRQIQNVAARFSRSEKLSSAEKEAYLEAAKQFRLPFWDYYRPRNYKITMPGVFKDNKTVSPYDYHMPQIFTLPEVMIKTLPDNELKPMINPFFKYDFAPGDLNPEEWEHSDLDTSIASSMQHTLRHGGLDKHAVDAMNISLNKIREDSMRQSLLMVELGVYSNFANFATNGVHLEPPLKNSTGSIEGLHNEYHVYIGGFVDPRRRLGHMSCIPVSAFDPVFWIHHGQIDRLFCIWQAVNSSHWFEDLPDKKPELAKEGLLPFRKYPLTEDPKNRFWTPDGIRSWEKLGYTYPDLLGSQDAEQIRDRFAKNYGWSRRLTPGQDFGKPPAHMMPLDLSRAQVYQYHIGVPSKELSRGLPVLNPELPIQQERAAESETKAVSNNLTYSLEWYIDDVVERMALNGSFTIFYIIGEVSGQSGEEWSKLPGFVGVTHIFAAPREACDNCGKQEEQAQLVTNTTPVASLLLDYVKVGRLESMEAEHVKPFLIKNLKWRVQTTLGEVVKPRDLAEKHGLRLSISCKTSPLPGQAGTVSFQFYPEIIEQIIANSS